MEDEDEFVRSALASLGPQPPNFRAIVELNRGGETAERADARPLTPRQVELKRAEGALLVDIRTDLQFDDAHVGGAIAITALRAGFGSKLAWLADREQEVVLIGRDDADALHAADLAAAVGITRFGGYLAGGMTSWREDRRPVERIERVALDDAARALGGGPRRRPGARRPRARRVGRRPHPGSVFTPYHDIRACPPSSTPTAPSPWCARQASAPPSARACCSGTARRRCGTWSRAACRGGSARGGLRHDLELASWVAEPSNSISKMPVIVALKETVSVLFGSSSFLMS